MARSKRSVEKEAFWRLVLDEHRLSGLNVRKFCQQEAISEHSFYSWRRRFKKGDPKSSSDSVNNGDRLIPVSVVNEDGENSTRPEPVPNAPLEIGTPGGFTLRFADGTTSETILRLLDVIARRPSGGAPSC